MSNLWKTLRPCTWLLRQNSYLPLCHKRNHYQMHLEGSIRKVGIYWWWSCNLPLYNSIMQYISLQIAFKWVWTNWTEHKPVEAYRSPLSKLDKHESIQQIWLRSMQFKSCSSHSFGVICYSKTVMRQRKRGKGQLSNWNRK